MTNKKAFSVGEMMIVLLIISVIMAASMPIITKRSKSTVENKNWQTTLNNADLYFNTGANQGVIIGASSFPVGKHAKLLLNTEDSNVTSVSHMLFSSKDKGVLAKLRFAEKQFEFGKDASALKTDTTAIGHSTTAGGDYATAIGSNANAKADNATALGYKSEAAAGGVALGEESKTGSNAIAIGSNVQATGTNSIAIGYGKQFSAEDTAVTTATGTAAIAIGQKAIVTKNYGIALGFNSSAGVSATALGPSSTASYDYSVAIGPGVATTKNNQLNLGTVNSATGITEINLGTTGTVVNIQGLVYQPSDIRKKDILGEYKYGLNDIIKIKTYEFKYKDDKNNKKRVGVIAQDIQKIFPNAVKKDEKGFLSIRKEDMFYAIINSIKELNTNYINLKKENDQLKKEIEELSKRIEKLEQNK